MLLGIILGLALGSGFCLLFIFLVFRSRRLKAEAKVRALLESAEKQAQARTREAELAAKDYLYQARAEFEKETKAIRTEQAQLQERLRHREETLDKKVELIDQKELELNRRDRKILAQEERVQQLEKEVREKSQEMSKKLEMVAGLSAAEAKKMLMDSLIEEAKHEAAIRIKQVEDEARAEAEKNAKRILSQAIDRYAGEYVAECTVSVIPLPNDEMKGRIIGREGRNIRTLEAATGVDLIVDDTPEAVVISSFNPVRREVARLTLERLIADGRIHPARIEEIVKKAEKEVDEAIRDAGQRAVFDVGAHGINPELVKLVGRLRYRTSYGQNQYQHSMEVAFLAGIMAGELNQNVKRARRAGMLHDIGKAVDQEYEGPHAQVGAELAKKFGESPQIVTAIASHHDDEPPTVLANLIQAADALSGARPGARREMLESYVKRLADLEKIAMSFNGVSKTYAIQAGRELRIMVEADKVSDENATVLAHEIAKKVETDLSYPGQIKVVVIRETRAMAMAK
jgi:ribonuclease Y